MAKNTENKKDDKKSYGRGGKSVRTSALTKFWNDIQGLFKSKDDKNFEKTKEVNSQVNDENQKLKEQLKELQNQFEQEKIEKETLQKEKIELKAQQEELQNQSKEMQKKQKKKLENEKAKNKYLQKRSERHARMSENEKEKYIKQKRIYEYNNETDGLNKSSNLTPKEMAETLQKEHDTTNKIVKDDLDKQQTKIKENLAKRKIRNIVKKKIKNQKPLSEEDIPIVKTIGKEFSGKIESALKNTNKLKNIHENRKKSIHHSHEI